MSISTSEVQQSELGNYNISRAWSDSLESSQVCDVSSANNQSIPSQIIVSEEQEQFNQAFGVNTGISMRGGNSYKWYQE